MKKVMVLMAPGFEEGETIEIVDVVRRGKSQCDIISTTEEYVSGTHEIVVKADRILGDNLDEFADYDMLVIPGGWSGVAHMEKDERVLQLVRNYMAQGKLVAAMCAAPNVLAKAGVCAGRVLTAYPGEKTEPNYKDAKYVKDVVVKDGNLITSRGPGTALPFAFALVDALGGDSAFIKGRFLYDEMKQWPDGLSN